MRPSSNQPGHFFTTTKAHNFESIEVISLESLKLYPVIDKKGTPLSRNEVSITDTFSFQELLKNASNDEYYEDVSSDVGSLFTSIPAQETVDYILQRIYVVKEKKAFCRKSIFKKLLLKLTKGCVFSIKNRLVKQIDGCRMGTPISLVSNIYVSKIEENIVPPTKPHSYKRYVDDTDIRKKKNKPDSLFQKLNSYHLNIKLTIGKNPKKFLYTKIIRHGCEIEIKVYKKSKKLPVHWSSKITTSYKHNAITGE